MASIYYDSSGKEVFNGDIVQDTDLNTINTAVDTGFQLVKVDIDRVNTEASYYSNLADIARTGAEVARAGAEAARDVCLTVQPIVITEGDTQIARVISIANSLLARVPVGTITPFLGGYFTNGSNGGFTNVIGNTAAAINARLNVDGYYVCNGAILNSSISSIFNGAGRYLPNLTDDRFIMGSTSGGIVGGDNSMSHTHTLSHTHYVDHVHNVSHVHTMSHGHTMEHLHATASLTLTIAQMPSHAHTFYNYGGDGSAYLGGGNGSAAQLLTTNAEGGSQAHNHGNTGYASNPYTSDSTSANTGASSIANSGSSTLPTSSNASTQTTSTPSYFENRPRFLSCFYIMKAF